MFTQHLRKLGDDFVVTVPVEEVQRHGWQEGQWVAVQLTEVEDGPGLEPELQAIVDKLLVEHEDALRYLADR